MSLLFSYNLANYMTGYWLRFIISFRPVYDFFFIIILLVGWLWWFGSACNALGIGRGQGGWDWKWILDKT